MARYQPYLTTIVSLKMRPESSFTHRPAITRYAVGDSVGHEL
jgi:hypothetical protein